MNLICNQYAAKINLENPQTLRENKYLEINKKALKLLKIFIMMMCCFKMELKHYFLQVRSSKEQHKAVPLLKELKQSKKSQLRSQ